MQVGKLISIMIIGMQEKDCSQRERTRARIARKSTRPVAAVGDIVVMEAIAAGRAGMVGCKSVLK